MTKQRSQCYKAVLQKESHLVIVLRWGSPKGGWPTNRRIKCQPNPTQVQAIALSWAKRSLFHRTDLLCGCIWQNFREACMPSPPPASHNSLQFLSITFIFSQLLYESCRRAVAIGHDKGLKKLSLFFEIPDSLLVWKRGLLQQKEDHTCFPPSSFGK